VGWGLLGWALLVVCVALPAWALAAGDLNEVAGWANILALPITALGVVLVLADRDRAGRASSPAEGRRRPWMAPPVDRMVDRPELTGWLVAALTGPGAAEVGLTTGLAGAGGFGKTWLASSVCHRPEVDRRYPGGLLWVTVGQEVRGADLAERVNDVAFALSGQRPAISDPDTAGAELGRLLDVHEAPVLLVVDDVWEEAQLRPFRFGGRACTRLVTTRIPDLLPGGPQLQVDAMSAGQARQLVGDRVDGLPADAADRLASLAGRWPVLLNVVNGVLRRRVGRGQPPGEAAEEIARRLAADGPAVFDPARPSDRSRAVAATVDASLTLLEPADRDRYLDLAVFPEDVDIPLDVLTLLWPGCPVDPLCAELAGLGLVADYRLDPPGPRLVLHDVIRAYLRARRGGADRAAVHRRLVEAAAGLLPAGAENGRPWWLLPDRAGYLYRYLPYHLHQAGMADELAELACDLRWVEAKTRRFASVVGALADLELVQAPTAALLREALAQAARLLGPISPGSALGATLASRLHGIPGLRAVLDRYRATLPRPRLDPVWPLPDRPDPTQPATAAGHTGGVTCCAFSPDGTLLASASDDGTTRLWHLPGGTQRLVLTGHTGGVWGCAFSPDGTLLATTSDDGTARLWRVADGSTAAVLAGHDGWVTCCAFSPDGALLATAAVDGTARLWRVGDNDVVRVLTGHRGEIWSCAFSPDGAALATCGLDGTVRLWQTARAEARVLASRTNGCRSCAFSPDGTLLVATYDDGTVRLCRTASGEEVAVLAGHTGRVYGCAFSPDGAMLATTSYGMVRLWQVPGGGGRGVPTGHTGQVNSCAFSPDGTLLATGSNDQTVRLWHIGTGRQLTLLTGRVSRVNGCAFSPDGALLASTMEDGTARLTRTSDGVEHAVITGHRSRISHCAFSPNGTLLATTSNDQTVRVWNVGTGTERMVLTGHTGWVRCCAFSPDGTLIASGGGDCTTRLWQVATGASHAVLHGHTGRVHSCAFSPDGTLLATASEDGTARLWDMPEGPERAVLHGHTDCVNSCTLSPDGALLATASNDRTVRLWRIPQGTEHAVLTGHTSWVERCAFSPDGTLLASVSTDQTVRLWHVATGRCHCALRLAAPVGGVAWHPTGTMLGAAGGAGVYLFAYEP
jgi:WD40 repeat protein